MMRGISTALTICAEIILNDRDEEAVRAKIWKKLIEAKSGQIERNAYTEGLVRGYLNILRALDAPEVI